MKIRYERGDLSFGVKTIDGLEDAVKGFLSGRGVVAPVIREKGAACVERLSAYDIDANEDQQIIVGFCKSGI